MAEPTTAAGEAAVGRVHQKLNKLFEKITTTLLEGFDNEDPEVQMQAAAVCSPAMLTSVGNWVKQNGVTCQPEQVEHISKNKELLKQKRKRGSQSNLRHIDPNLEASDIASGG